MSAKNDISGGIPSENLEMLQKSNTRLAANDLRQLVDQPGRFTEFSRSLEGLLLDFTRVRIDRQALNELFDAARASNVEGRRDALFAGADVNSTEGRPALHMALRSSEVLDSVGGEEAERVSQAMQTMLAWAELMHQGRLPSDPDQVIEHVVHVGIGGSLLGTQLVCDALDAGDSPLRVHFLGSVDATESERLLARLDPTRTMVVLVSKSFSTGDTLLHGRRLRSWLQQSLEPDEAMQRMFAVTSQVERARSFGIDPARLLYFSDWVGGRYSLWSPVSLSAAGLVGPARFTQMLEGAAAMDRHFVDAGLEENLPIIFGLVGLWHRNICGFQTWGVMPYDQRLRRLHSHLQQLVMESNGKSASLDNKYADLATAPVVWGEIGTNAQHSVFQAMHQGSDIVPLHFVGVVRPDHADEEAQDELLANMLAQLAALARGRDEAETRAELPGLDASLLAHRSFAGNRPSELVLLDELTPRLLGMLLALYEHKVYVESVLWNINAFDQWGVELGKTLTPDIQAALANRGPAGEGLDSLLEYIHARRR